MRKIILTVLFSFFCVIVFSQELKATINLVTNQVGNNVNRNTFQTLKTSLVNFLNNRKWSSETYAQNERIECTFLLTIESIFLSFRSFVESYSIDEFSSIFSIIFESL
jgi:hypothetical protein